ncbi:2-oxoglutarate (2OG) and Fe(II)-dependent oxygenase superfamily protein [Tanacetum coccineum]
MENRIFAGYHYDLSFITIHYRSEFPGLYIWQRNEKRVKVKVREGCLLILSGKQIQQLLISTFSLFQLSVGINTHLWRPINDVILTDMNTEHSPNNLQSSCSTFSILFFNIKGEVSCDFGAIRVHQDTTALETRNGSWKREFWSSAPTLRKFWIEWSYLVVSLEGDYDGRLRRVQDSWYPGEVQNGVMTGLHRFHFISYSLGIICRKMRNGVIKSFNNLWHVTLLMAFAVKSSRNCLFECPLFASWLGKHLKLAAMTFDHFKLIIFTSWRGKLLQLVAMANICILSESLHSRTSWLEKLTLSTSWQGMLKSDNEGFPKWEEAIDSWGYKLMSAVEVVAEMTAIGFGLPKDAFTDLLKSGPHLLSPTGGDIGSHGKEDFCRISL